MGDYSWDRAIMGDHMSKKQQKAVIIQQKPQTVKQHKFRSIKLKKCKIKCLWCKVSIIVIILYKSGSSGY